MKPFQDFLALPKKWFSRYYDLHLTTNFPNTGSIFDKTLCKQVASLTFKRYSNGNVSRFNFKSLDVSFFLLKPDFLAQLNCFSREIRRERFRPHNYTAF